MTTRQPVGASGEAGGSAARRTASDVDVGWTSLDDSPERAGENAVTELVMRTFRLNGLFMAAGDALSKPAGLTSARWQVLGAVLREPRTVAGIGREMGLTRQSVQRLANELNTQGMIEFVPNPAHRRSPLVRPTTAGRKAISVIARSQPLWVQAIADEVGADRVRQCVEVLNDVIVAASRSALIAGHPLTEPQSEPAS